MARSHRQPWQIIPHDTRRIAKSLPELPRLVVQSDAEAAEPRLIAHKEQGGGFRAPKRQPVAADIAMRAAGSGHDDGYPGGALFMGLLLSKPLNLQFWEPPRRGECADHHERDCNPTTKTCA